ncbi:DUF2330 domain-containing protein [Salana multivorans]|uniref:DUF2330 domain-containing protein n=1 Tax=Salana multivorans TaxID=120377 RepID=UPI000F4CB79E|nr:DUF2330 domain-containing protein [Salana multivorans]MBN8883665.1 DUF2330 domain-containing protein [Salana multivorans]
MTPQPRADRPARRLRRVAAATVLAVGGIGVAVPAAAVDPIATAGALDVVDQTTVVSWVDGVERLLVDVRAVGQLESGAQSMLILATPTTPTITEGSREVITAVAAASAPEEVVEERWWPDLESFGGSSDEAAAAREAVYPIAPDGIGAYPAESADSWISWLSERGYQLADQDVSLIQRYAGAGWAISVVQVEMPAGTVNGGPPPIDVSFASETPVVPMVLASTGSQSLTYTSYVLAAERMDRSDPLRGNSTLLFSGPVTARQYPELSDWLEPFGGSAVLTKSVQTFPSPSRITEDLTFSVSTYGPFDAGTETKVVDRIILGLPAGLMLVAGGMLLLAILGIVLSQILQRRYR